MIVIDDVAEFLYLFLEFRASVVFSEQKFWEWCEIAVYDDNGIKFCLVERRVLTFWFHIFCSIPGKPIL